MSLPQPLLSLFRSKDTSVSHQFWRIERVGLVELGYVPRTLGRRTSGRRAVSKDLCQYLTFEGIHQA